MISRRWSGVLAFALAMISAGAVRSSPASAQSSGATAGFAVGPQYTTAHVYVAAQDLDRFAAAFVATFGGTASPKRELTVTPVPSKAMWRAVSTPSGSISVFGYVTPIPYPFGSEIGGFLVTDLDRAVTEAREDGASVLVAPFNDPIGRDAVVEWPGCGVADLETTLARAVRAGVTVLVPPVTSDEGTSAFVQFPGGYIAEIHTAR